MLQSSVSLKDSVFLHSFLTPGESGSTLKKKKENYFSVKTNSYVSGIASLFYFVQDSSLAPVKWNAPGYI